MFPSSLQYVQDYKLRDGMVTRQEGSGGGRELEGRKDEVLWFLAALKIF